MVEQEFEQRLEGEPWRRGESTADGGNGELAEEIELGGSG